VAARNTNPGKTKAGNAKHPASNAQPPAVERGVAGGWIFPLLFGLFLGLTLWKFGNPVVLDSKVAAPNSFSEAWSQPWPPRWGIWFLIPFVLFGVGTVMANKTRWPGSRWLWVLPVVWFGWQFVSATHTVDSSLTVLTLTHFAGCIACYFLGGFLPGEERGFRLLLLGLLAAFTFCLVRAVDQKLFEFPQERQALLEGERTGWTNFAPEVLVQMKNDTIIITTNGVDVANPKVMAKYDKGRVQGTLVYPNALAGAILLLLPLLLALAINGTRRFRTLTRAGAIVLTLFLGFGSLFWTGSKSGWLIAVVMLAVCLFRLNWSPRLKWIALALVMTVGLAAFALRFQSYFSAGATSVGARFDYWRAAVENTREHPTFGSGPGTFQRAYALVKAPDSEMARLAHNDYLEQFSDSGIISGLSYTAWIGLLLLTLGRRVWRAAEPVGFAVFIGLLGWFAQGLSEFSLYVPALAWTAFALGGSLLKQTGNSNRV
jgi:O-antigen ligase